MIVEFGPETRARLVAGARATWPREACGLLVGRRRGDTATVDAVVAIDNLAVSPDAFVIEPLAVARADAAARAKGRAIVGTWHSHPRSPAVPSERDRECASADWICAIVSIDGPADDIRAWRLVDGAFVEDDVAP